METKEFFMTCAVKVLDFMAITIPEQRTDLKLDFSTKMNQNFLLKPKSAVTLIFIGWTITLFGKSIL